MLLVAHGILQTLIMIQPNHLCPETGGGHGTSVAGIIAAKGWNNIGVRGDCTKCINLW